LPRVLPGILPWHSRLFFSLNIRVFAATITATLPCQFQEVCRRNCHNITACFPQLCREFAS
jgi:hypothetical protein